MLGAWAGATSWGASALSPSVAQCQRYQRRLKNAVDKANEKGGRYVLGIRMGSGAKRIDKLKRKAAEACAAAAAQDPSRAFQEAYAQGGSLVPVVSAPADPLSMGTIALAVGAVVALVGIGAVALTMGSGDAPSTSEGRYAPR